MRGSLEGREIILSANYNGQHAFLCLVTAYVKLHYLTRSFRLFRPPASNLKHNCNLGQNRVTDM
jgi:hypothetical protein